VAFLFDVFFHDYEKTVPLKLSGKEIYPVSDKRIITDFAVSKILLPEDSAGNAEQQCEKWLKVGLHSNILQLYDYLFQDGCFYAAHEWHHDIMHTLAETIADKSFYDFKNAESLITKVLKIGESIFSALAYAQTLGLKHYALNSESIYLMPTGVKIGDFWNFSENQETTAAGSCALIMLELLCGRKCFENSEDAIQHLDEIRQQFLCGVPDNLLQFIQNCLTEPAYSPMDAWNNLYQIYADYSCEFAFLAPKITPESPYGHINNAVIGSKRFDSAQEIARALEIAPDNALAVYHQALPDVLNGSYTPFDVLERINDECNDGTRAFFSEAKKLDFIYGGMECLYRSPNHDNSLLQHSKPTECSYPCEDGTVFSAVFKCKQGIISCNWKTADGKEINVLSQPIRKSKSGELVPSDNYTEYIEKATGRRLRVTTANMNTMAVSFSPSGEYLGIAETDQRYIYHFWVFRVPEQLKEPERYFFSNPYLNMIQEYQNSKYQNALLNMQGKSETVENYAKKIQEWEKDIRINALPEFALAKRRLLPYISKAEKRLSAMLWEKQFSETIDFYSVNANGNYSLVVTDNRRKLYFIWNYTGEIIETYTLKTGEQYALKYVQFEDISDDISQSVTVYYQSLQEDQPDYYESYSITPKKTGMFGMETDENSEPLPEKNKADKLLKNILPDYSGLTDDQETVVLAMKDNILRLYTTDCHYESSLLQNKDKFIIFNNHISLEEEETNPVQPEKEQSESVPETTQKQDIPKGENYLEYLGNMMQKLKTTLSKCVLGQESAISTFCNAWFNAELFKNDTSNKPRAIFTFAGPPGVGKTMLAENAANIMGRKVHKFDMSDYSGRESIHILAGFEYTWKDATCGTLTKYVLENPECVLIFDEIEKASPDVLKLFLQILDRGELQDLFFSTISQTKNQEKKTDEIQKLLEKYEKSNKKVSFKDTIIIFTTNTAKNLYETSEKHHSLSPQNVFNAIAEDINPETNMPYFAPEFVSRLASGTLIMFEHLKPHDLMEIGRGILKDFSKTLMMNYQIQIILGKNPDDPQEVNRLLTALLLSVGGTPDARRLTFHINNFVKSQLQRAILESGLGSKLRTLRLEMPSEFDQSQIRDLFIENEKPSVLIYASDETYLKIEKSCHSLDVQHADTVIKASVLAAQKNIKLALVDIFHSSAPVQSASDDKSIAAKGAKRLRQGTETIRNIQKTNPDLPIYLLQSDEDRSYESNTIRSYLDIGVRGIVKVKPEEIMKITATLYMQSVAEELAHTQKVLHYEVRLKVDEPNYTVRAILSDLVLEPAPKASDRANLIAPCERPEDKFDDIIGCESAKKELKHISEYLNNPSTFAMKGYPVPSGVLLYGSPGTGKTMLARACASESNVSFIPTQGSLLLSQKVQGVRNLFSMARRNAPCIIFIDEIDSIGKQRTGEDTYTEAILNTLLAEMDGFDKNTRRPVIVIAATNADLGDGSGISKIDAALARRFSKTIKIDEPNEEDRKALLKLFTGDKLSEDKLKTYAGMTIGFSPAEIKKCVMSALQEAIENGQELNGQYIEKAIEYELYGSESENLTQAELQQVAWHEIGHTICHIYAGYMPLYVTVVSRKDHGGYMAFDLNSIKHFPSRHDMLMRIMTDLGGRAGESIYFNNPDDITAGASGDLYHATELAYDMINRFGLADGLAVHTPRLLGTHPHSREFINKTLLKQLRLAKQIINNNLHLTHVLVDELCEKRRLTGEEIKEIVDQIGFNRTVTEEESQTKDGETDEKSERNSS